MKKIFALFAAMVTVVAMMVIPGTAYAASSPCTINGYTGNCGPYTYSQNTESDGYNTYVGPDGWNCNGNCTSESITANSPGDWSADLNAPAGNTAVLAYPSNSQGMSESGPGLPLSKFTSIKSTFSETMPHNAQTIAHAAYDLWLDNWNTEVMIDVDRSNYPNGGTTVDGHATVAGQKWTLLNYGSEWIWSLGPTASKMVNESSGTVHILALLHWMVNHGDLAASIVPTNFGFGWEICSTGGVSEHFAVTSYSLTNSPVSN